MSYGLGNRHAHHRSPTSGATSNAVVSPGVLSISHCALKDKPRTGRNANADQAEEILCLFPFAGASSNAVVSPAVLSALKDRFSKITLQIGRRCSRVSTQTPGVRARASSQRRHMALSSPRSR